MAETIQRTFTHAPWEKKVGYCRAIRMGSVIAVTGTTSLDEKGEVHAPGDAYAQAKRCLEIIERAIEPLGASRQNIIRTRIFVTDIQRWEEFGRAHGQFFADCPPATTMVEVKALIDPRMLVEIEADAVVLTPARWRSASKNLSRDRFGNQTLSNRSDGGGSA